MNVLVVNAGSSSLKYQLFDTSKNEVLAKGICERIGIGGKIEHKIGDKKYTEETDIPNHTVATQLVVKYLTDPEMGCVKSMNEIEAVGHRIVHGGEYFSESMLLTEETLEKLELCRDLAPLHTGAHIMGIQGCLEAMPGKPQVLVFDTAFHQTMEKHVYMYGLPYEMYEKYHIRRYGAHGTSHRYVAAEAAKLLDKPLEETKIITCHIGNGSSISAVKGGKCIDTSMGFTPLAGILMGTRCGDIDPAIVTYIMKNEGLTPDEMSDWMNKKCGFLGLSGISSDSRDIEAAILEGNDRALLAATTLAYQVKRYIGAYTAAMDGLDAVIFTAGMGENNPELRERACANLENFGIKLDLELNAKTLRQPNTVLLSTPDSKVKVYVIPTNEELVIASDTEAIVKAL
ncbi:MAG: acetate kinase [Clostridia bacterium]|nr:acetate kinase [Clostridia bacterium]